MSLMKSDILKFCCVLYVWFSCRRSINYGIINYTIETVITKTYIYMWENTYNIEEIKNTKLNGHNDFKYIKVICKDWKSKVFRYRSNILMELLCLKNESEQILMIL